MADESATPSPPGGGSTLTKSRMEAISDGVMAFAMTLLVVDLAVRPPGSPLHQFLRSWPSYLAYLISFLTIGGAWIAHSGLTDSLEGVDRIFLRLNLVFLMLIAFLPFPTSLVGDALRETAGAERVATVVYGTTLLAIRLMFIVLSGYTRHTDLRQTGSADADMQEATKNFRYVVVGYLITIAVSLLFPVVAVVLYLVIALYLFVPFRAVAQELTGRRANSARPPAGPGGGGSA
ncbi:MAG TPA: TMEM175 family protein [Acidimicrobiales bacterium]|nr:TMEM175 family protein [Acidimicrobiales bacterium]